mmetsp:Transcript_37721/g.43347  ORF Transcript_37721/g.43347 Transcript_37721/m.43347 type:complete len:118 (-) Transcript_37721:54-407(-)|eukprot:CAMPEP_0168339772 /NCGR_PEP_ID=MMETSP0213-20121227/13663_1 /TAXON_ID=151035 /ORGANISM="Euplotes harpa, Strain FSP1.4" /LENGTH=117 /DNA_ID=CAMNT_0008345873 /DNA_START=53 /DNA_END=406 /DNA_ORIENTATION=-
MFKYKENNKDFLTRKNESAKLREKYSDRIPIICEKSPTSKLENLDKDKYLVPNELCAFQFAYIIRKRIQLQDNEALYLFVNGKNLLKADSLMADIYENKRDADGFLYITYTEENTVG